MRAPRTALTAPAAGALAAVVLLAGCTSGGPAEPAPPLPEALTEYTALHDDVLAAVEHGPDVPELTWAESGTATYPAVQEQEDGECVLFVTNVNGTGTVDDARATLGALAAAVGPVVEEHGFEPLSEIQQSDVNGDLWVESSDPSGWTFEVRGGGQSSAEAPDAVVELSLSGPVTTGDCDDQALEQAVVDAG